jgi:hypothetical protein
MRFDAPTREDLLALEAKYAQLEALRRARERGEPIPERAVFKALAGQFPGALRELDKLPMVVIEMRRQQLGIAVAGGLVEPWMAWMVAYHALLRAALWIKMRTAKRPDVTSERVVILVRGVADEFGFGVDEQFVVDVARPQAGRINAVVLGRLEVIFGVSMGELRRGLFGLG